MNAVVPKKIHIPNPLHHIPNPIHIITSHIPNPLSWINDPLKDIYNKVSQLVQLVLVHPPRTNLGSLQTYLFGGAYALAAQLSLAVLLVVIVMAMLARHKIRNLLEAVVVLLVLAGGGEVWFAACSGLVSTGNALAQAAAFYHPTGQHSSNGFFGLPGIGNLLLSIWGLSFIVAAAGLLVTTVFFYQLMAIFVTFVGLPAFALYPLGDRAKKFFKMLVSIGLVSMTFGRPAGIFFLNVGRAAVDHAPFSNSAFGDFVYTLGGLLLGTAAQFALVAACYKSITAVQGYLSTTTRGSVEATLKKFTKVDLKKLRAEVAQTTRPLPVQVVNAQPSAGQQATAAGKKAVVTKLATKLVAVQPELAPFVVVGTKFAHQRIDRKTKQKAARKAR